nr:gem-associated protein 8-like isoform X3 [Oryctolagus cuniculus]XP_051686907.1 gem-associated protein 8-like isoform X4 [Oryctolagus cuniculus]
MQVSMRKDQTVSEEEKEEEELESESDVEVECDLSNMEITEELRRYFATTEKHREERRSQIHRKCLENMVVYRHVCFLKGFAASSSVLSPQ